MGISCTFSKTNLKNNEETHEMLSYSAFLLANIFCQNKTTCLKKYLKQIKCFILFFVKTNQLIKHQIQFDANTLPLQSMFAYIKNRPLMQPEQIKLDDQNRPFSGSCKNITRM